MSYFIRGLKASSESCGASTVRFVRSQTSPLRIQNGYILNSGTGPKGPFQGHGRAKALPSKGRRALPGPPPRETGDSAPSGPYQALPCAPLAPGSPTAGPGAGYSGALTPRQPAGPAIGRASSSYVQAVCCSRVEGCTRSGHEAARVP